MRREGRVAGIGNRAHGVVDRAGHCVVGVTGVHGASARREPAPPDTDAGERVVFDRQVKNSGGRIVHGTLVIHRPPVDLIENVGPVTGAAVHTDGARAVRDLRVNAVVRNLKKGRTSDRHA